MATNPPGAPAPQAPASPEPGYTTTEFWGTQITALIAQMVALFTAFGAIHWSDQQRAIVFAVAQSVVMMAEAAYAVSRGVRKAGT